MAYAESAQSGCLKLQLTTELRVSKIDTHGERIGGRAILGLNLNICALYAKSVFIANGTKQLPANVPVEPSHIERMRRLPPPR